MTHLGSVCSIISVTQAGRMAYWQALCRKEKPGPFAAQKRGLPGQWRQAGSENLLIGLI